MADDLETLAASACPGCVRVVDALVAKVETREAEIKRLNAAMIAVGKGFLVDCPSCNANLEQARLAKESGSRLLNDNDAYDILSVEFDALKAEFEQVRANDQARSETIVRLEADLARRARLGASRELDEKDDRIRAAIDILRTPGTWSEFASRAIKVLEGK